MAGIEMIGKRFGRLVVIERHHSTPKKVFWRCKCDCGNETVVDGWSLRSGETKSCGCYRLDRVHETAFIDITGQRFGNLTVLEYSHNDARRQTYYRCKCDCGKIIVTRGSALRTGHAKSCGCMNKAKTHNMHGTRLYRIHSSMIKRCYNETDDHYYNYGGRGITICKEWHNPDVRKGEKHKAGNPWFLNFYHWAIENGYDDSKTIDRIDVNGPYAPWNCRWISNAEQQLNKRNTQFIHDGEELLVRSEFCNKYGVDSNFVRNKLDAGWSLDAIVLAAKYPERGIHRPGRSQQKYHLGKHTYLDKDQFEVMIPKIKDQVII